MVTKFIEVTNEEFGRVFNHGKFMVARFTPDEWARKSALPESKTFPLLHFTGWDPIAHVMVFDLQTGEGAIFKAVSHGYVKADLNKHRIWVCPMFEPFLEWLYQQNLSDLTTLPNHVHLKDAPSDMQGYRRPGPE